MFPGDIFSLRRQFTEIHYFSTQVRNEVRQQFFVMTQFMYKTKMFISIYHLSFVHHLELFPKCIERYWFMASRTKKKIWLKTFKRWVATNFHGHKKLLRMISWKWKIVFHGNWNPRAWSTDLPWDWLYLQHIKWIDILRTFGGSCGLLFTTVWKIDILSNIDSHHDMCITLGMMLRFPARSELLHPKHHQCFMQHPQKFQKHSSLVCHYHGM